MIDTIWSNNDLNSSYLIKLGLGHVNDSVEPVNNQNFLIDESKYAVHDIIWDIACRPSNSKAQQNIVQFAICGGKRIRLFEIAYDQLNNGVNLHQIWQSPLIIENKNTKQVVHKRSIRRLAFDETGSTLAAASFDGSVSVWTIHEDESIEPTPFPDGGCESSLIGTRVTYWSSIHGHQNEVKCVSFFLSAAERQLLASCGRDKTIWINLRNETDFVCEDILQGHLQDIKVVRWIPIPDWWYNQDAQFMIGDENQCVSLFPKILISGSYDETFRLWSNFNNQVQWVCQQSLEVDGTALDIAVRECSTEIAVVTELGSILIYENTALLQRFNILYGCDHGISSGPVTVVDSNNINDMPINQTIDPPPRSPRLGALLLNRVHGGFLQTAALCSATKETMDNKSKLFSSFAEPVFRVDSDNSGVSLSDMEPDSTSEMGEELPRILDAPDAEGNQHIASVGKELGTVLEDEPDLQKCTMFQGLPIAYMRKSNSVHVEERAVMYSVDWKTIKVPWSDDEYCDIIAVACSDCTFRLFSRVIRSSWSYDFIEPASQREVVSPWRQVLTQTVGSCELNTVSVLNRYEKSDNHIVAYCVTGGDENAVILWKILIGKSTENDHQLKFST